MRRFSLFDNMAGRIFVILLVGIIVAATFGVKLADQKRQSDLRHLQDITAAERIDTFLRRLDNTPAENREEMVKKGFGFLRLTKRLPRGAPNTTLTGLIKRRLPQGINAKITNIPIPVCFNAGRRKERETRLERAWRDTVETTDCWGITAQLSDGSEWGFITGPPAFLLSSRSLINPAFLIVLVLAAGLLTWIVARMATRPIRVLTDAAAQFGPDFDSPQLTEKGPADVRTAITAFNAMQKRLRHHVHEQTHMISAITHDLQTPMTRLRLRLDEVGDENLRSRLLADWRAMREIVDEGLELARSTGMRENVAQLDVDSMIASIVEDAQEMGHTASFDQAAGKDIRCRPQMLLRCVQNLVDNAIKYGGSAHLATIATSKGLVIEVRDHGPGIPDDRLEDVFEPMVRLEESRSRETGGTGLGLTIARIMARRNGGEIKLCNAPGGGLIATVLLEGVV